MKNTINYIRSVTDFHPSVGIILGTGLGDLVSHVNIVQSIDYADIPDFPVSTVESHHGKLIFGTFMDKNVVIMQGRFHYYEGYDMKQITFPVRIMKQLGIEHLLISNISGGLNPDYKEGDLMILNDHINLLPDNPLRGPNDDSMGPRFPDMLHTYHPALIQMAFDYGCSEGYTVHQGVYAAVMGPNLETPAEYKFLRIIGADAVGMSTIPEVVVARHMGIPVFAASIITDMCVPGSIKPVNIAEIIEYANIGQPKLTRIFGELVANLSSVRLLS